MTKLLIQTKNDNFILDIWNSQIVEHNIIIYYLDDKYTDSLVEKGDISDDSDYLKFISYLNIDNSTDNWWYRSGQTISIETTINKYKFYWLASTAIGDILNIIPFEAESISLINDIRN